MMRKVLIIYPWINQEVPVYHIVKNLRKNGVNIDAINSTYLKYAAKPIVKPSRRLKIVGFLYNLPIPKIKGVLSRVFNVNVEKELLKIVAKYDLIDFHFLQRSYDNIILKIIDCKIVKITILGSDFYRADKERRERQRIIFNKCDCIQMATNAMKNDFIEYFNDFEEKITVAMFGTLLLDVISQVQNTTYSPQYKTGNYSDKLMVVCGYNGSIGQQHSIIIESLRKLDERIKDKIFLVFPMTYGSTKAYTIKIESELEDIGISFLILKSFLSELELVKLRIEADLVINIQITDAFAGSLKQHLYAENLLLVGDWLPYGILDENQVFYKKTSIDDLDNQINDSIVNFDKYKSMIDGNKKKTHKMFSWSYAGERVSRIYKDLLK